jgi:fumarate hydratase class II
MSMASEKGFRIEKDSMGEISVPSDALWGAQTARAVLNFRISDRRIPEELRTALGWIKEGAAVAHQELEMFPEEVCDAVEEAAREVRRGAMADQFPIDLFQTGSGTSWNMNVNEVIASRANEILGFTLTSKGPVHPNDTVNRGQSSNDVIPSALQIAARLSAGKLEKSLHYLIDVIERKAKESRDVIKLGRTHLQDAVPMRGSQELGAWAGQLHQIIRRLRSSYAALEQLPLGGTAIGTGLNSSREFASLMVAHIASGTAVPFLPMDNPFTGIAARDASLEFADVLNALAVVIMKISQDLRLLSSGPRAGLAELRLPELQPGSSIMPGKVNPVIPEMAMQAAVCVMGKHTSITIACQNAPLQLNIMMPLIAGELLESASILTALCRELADKCIAGMSYDRERCRSLIEGSLAMVTPLALETGYDKAAEIAKEAYRTGETVRAVAMRESGLAPGKIDTLLDPEKMCGPSE